MKYEIVTLGCKVNQAESDSLKEKMDFFGYEFCSDSSADIFIINTCCVTSTSEKKARNLIRKAKRLNPNCIVCVIGCYAQTSREKLIEIGEIDIILGNKKESLPWVINRFLSNQKVLDDVWDAFDEDFEDFMISKLPTSTRANIKIQDGCEGYCSYCIIPYARGKLRSKDFDLAIKEVSELVKLGIKELVLTGIHITSYSHKGYGLIDLLERINHLEGDFRFRLGSLSTEYFTSDIIHRISKLDKLCKHFHLSLQSGSDRILKLMNRRYSRDFYLQVVNEIHREISDAAVTTDIIVGFPSEKEVDFGDTLSLIKEVNFLRIHYFPFSPRPGTPASEMKEFVSRDIVQSRIALLEKETEKSVLNFSKTCINKEHVVLIEENDGNFSYGYSSNYVPFKIKAKKTSVNRFANVKGEHLGKDGIIVGKEI